MNDAMSPRLRDAPVPAQRGLTLIIVMLILVVVTILGIGGAQIALLGERSTRYDRDYLVASQAAEAALVDAEADIDGAGTRAASFTPNNLGIFPWDACGTTDPTNLGLCRPSDLARQPQLWATVNFVNGDNSVPFGKFTGRTLRSGNVGIQPELPPRYIIELVVDQTPPIVAAAPVYMYRITAIGFGPRKEVQVVMQTAYRK